MIALSYYLLKVTVCSGILCGYYLLALRNRIFHHWNRYYLLATVVLSLLLPLVRIPIAQPPAEEAYRPIRLLEAVTTGDAYVEELRQSPPLRIGTEQWMMLGYLLAAAFFLFVFIRSLMRIRILLQRHEVKSIGDLRFVNTKEEGTPFSFLRYIFWHQDISMESPAGRQMLTHEMVHIREYHTHDKLFLNLVLVACWCNPFFWFIRREMAMIHEFIADSRSVDGEDTAAFAAMILQAAWPGQRFDLTNPFFHSPIKRRLKMLIRSRNKRVNYFTRILALPLLVAVAAAFTLKPGGGVTAAQKVTGMNDRKWTFVIDAGHGGSDPGVSTADGLTEKDLTLAIARKVRELNTDPSIEIILTRETDVLQPLREKVDRTVAQSPDAFVSIHINGTSPNGGNEIASGIEVWLGSRNKPLESDNLLLGSLIQDALSKSYKTLDTLRTRKTGIWVLDAPNINYPAALVECGYLTNPKDRAFISKAENQERIARDILTALKRFAGHSASNVDEKSTVVRSRQDTQPRLTVIDTVTRTVKKISMTMSGDMKGTDALKAEKLLIINGKPLEMRDILNKTVEADSATFYKKNDPVAIVKYGEAGRKGVIEFHNARIWEPRTINKSVADTMISDLKTIDITPEGVTMTYRDGRTEKISREEAYRRNMIPADNMNVKVTSTGPPNIYIQKTGGNQSMNVEPLYVIDGVMLGKDVAQEALNLMAKPNDIATVNVLKGQSAITLYGEKGKNGVIEIHTKKGGWNGDMKGMVELSDLRIDDGSPAFTKVEVPAAYPGGKSALESRIRKEVESNSVIAKDNKELKGQCGIRFFVDKYGSLSGFTLTEKTTNNKLAMLVIDILKRGPEWQAAEQNGKKVKTVEEILFKF
jgi:TonB-dependent SusC/RagA subfamily outer membrane receptor